ncbi:MAG: DUF167 domain-containing protein [Verrucomicrobiota bacterium]|jgi:uncharacterized protein (TIGR00251 family)|nr:DUF167 domain-containing protein [Verrucomicrobiota bacterium]
MNWLSTTSGGCIVTVKATPRARASEITGAEPEWLRVRLQAPPVDGKANAALVELFAKRFGVSKRTVEILSGDTSRLKRVKLHGLSEETVRAALIPEAP